MHMHAGTTRNLGLRVYSHCWFLARMQPRAPVHLVTAWWARHMHAMGSSQTIRSTKTTVHNADKWVFNEFYAAITLSANAQTPKRAARIWVSKEVFRRERSKEGKRVLSAWWRRFMVHPKPHRNLFRARPTRTNARPQCHRNSRTVVRNLELPRGLADGVWVK